MATRISVSSPAPADRSDTAERVVRIAYVDPQSYHGLAKYDAGYLRGLRDAGFDGELLFYCSKLFEEPAPKGVALRPIFSYNRKRFAALKAFSYIRSMVSIVIDSFLARADVYHFQWFKLPPIDYLFVLVMRKLAHVRVVMTAHNVAPHGDEGGDHRWLGLLYRSVDAVIVHNEKTAQEIAERFSVALARISVLRHGPIKTEARGRTRHRKRIEAFAATRDLRFLFIGRGSRYKGLDVLLEAWVRFVKVAPGKPGLIVIGEVDDELTELTARVAREEETVLLINEYVSDADLYHAMRNTDVAVLPHRRISQSGALLTALAQRIPVLVSRLPGLVEPFEHARVGWEFDGTVGGLGDALLLLAKNRERVKEVRADETAWQALEDAYAWCRIGLSAREVYRELTAQRITPPALTRTRR